MKKLLALSMILSLIGGMAMADKQTGEQSGTLPGDKTQCGGQLCTPGPDKPGDSEFGKAGGSGLLGTDDQAVDYGQFQGPHRHEMGGGGPIPE